MSVKLRDVLATMPVYRPGESPDECEMEGAFKLSSNESPYEPPVAVQRAIECTLSELNRYPDYYKEALCDELAAYYGLPVGMVAVDNGSGTLLQDLVRICCDAGDEVAYCAPTFAAYEIDVKLAGAVPVVLPLDGSSTFDLDALARAVEPRTRMIVVCNPNNPTGTYVAAPALEAFIARVPADVLVVIDEAYHDFERVEPLDATLRLLSAHDNVVLLRTFSKALGLAGMRIGYCLAARYLVDAINKTIAEFSVSSPAQAAARACLAPEVDALVKRRVDDIVFQRNRFEQALAEAHIAYIPSSANFVMLPTPEPMRLFATFKDAGVITRPFENPSGVRITIGTAEQMERAARALDIVLL